MKLLTTISLMLFLSISLSSQSYLLDQSFGENGVQITDLGNSTDVATDAAITSDGAVIIGGCKGNPQYDFMLLKKRLDGTLDADFGNEGQSSFDLGNVMDDGTCNTLQGNGNILIAGITGTNSAIVQYLPNGTPDLSFGDNGKVKVELSGASIIQDIKVQADGKIVITGSVSTTYTTGSIGALVMRFLPSGKLDTSFGENGQVVFANQNQFTEGKSIAINSNGKILIGINTSGHAGIVQLKNNGSIDTSFGDQGFMIYSEENGAVQDILVLEDDQIMVTVFFQGRYSSGLLQVKPTGVLNTNFGTNGFTEVKIDGKKILATNTFLSKAGEFVMGGNYMNLDQTESAMMLARFSKNGEWLKENNSKGIIISAVENSIAVCATVLENKEGKIISIGFSEDKYTGEKDIAHFQYVASDATVGIAAVSTVQAISLYPNPVVQFTQLKYQLENSTSISLNLFDVQGRLVETFVENDFRNAGVQQEAIELPSALPSGMYVLHLTTQEGSRETILLTK